MTTRAVLGSGLAFLLAAGCGITVIVPGEAADAAGTGAGAGHAGGGGSGASSATAGAGTAGGAGSCMDTCSVPSNGVDTCACSFACGAYPGDGSVTCAPNVDLQGNSHVLCVCNVLGFTGDCYETKPEFLCQLDQGCCGAYLGQ